VVIVVVSFVGVQIDLRDLSTPLKIVDGPLDVCDPLYGPSMIIRLLIWLISYFLVVFLYCYFVFGYVVKELNSVLIFFDQL
jgi:hypothetical protein